jgi:hypothetical protein
MTFTAPAQPSDCVSRFPIQAKVNNGKAPEAANRSVKMMLHVIPSRKFRLPPR